MESKHNFMRDFASESGMTRKDKIIYNIECGIMAVVMIVAVWVIMN